MGGLKARLGSIIWRPRIRSSASWTRLRVIIQSKRRRCANGLSLLNARSSRTWVLPSPNSPGLPRSLSCGVSAKAPEFCSASHNISQAGSISASSKPMAFGVRSSAEVHPKPTRSHDNGAPRSSIGAGDQSLRRSRDESPTPSFDLGRSKDGAARKGRNKLIANTYPVASRWTRQSRTSGSLRRLRARRSTRDPIRAL
jgi:hypothetical protein